MAAVLKEIEANETVNEESSFFPSWLLGRNAISSSFYRPPWILLYIFSLFIASILPLAVLTRLVGLFITESIILNMDYSMLLKRNKKKRGTYHRTKTTNSKLWSKYSRILGQDSPICPLLNGICRATQLFPSHLIWPTLCTTLAENVFPSMYWYLLVRTPPKPPSTPICMASRRLYIQQAPPYIPVSKRCLRK